MLKSPILSKFSENRTNTPAFKQEMKFVIFAFYYNRKKFLIMKLQTPKYDLHELKFYEKKAHFFGNLNYDDFNCKGMGSVYDESGMAVKSAQGMINLIYNALANTQNNRIVINLRPDDISIIDDTIQYLKHSKHILFCADIYFFSGLHLDISKVEPVAVGCFNKYMSILESVVSNYQSMYDDFQADTMRNINLDMGILKDGHSINPIFEHRLANFLQGTPKPYRNKVELLRYYDYAGNRRKFNQVYAKLPSLPDPEF